MRRRRRRRCEEEEEEEEVGRSDVGAAVCSSTFLFKIKQTGSKERSDGADGSGPHNFSLDWTQMNGPDCSSMICFT